MTKLYVESTGYCWSCWRCTHGWKNNFILGSVDSAPRNFQESGYKGSGWINTLSACVAISMAVTANWYPDYTQQYLSCGCIALLLHPTGSLTKLSGNFFSLLLCWDKLILLLVKLVLKRTKQALLSNTTEHGSIKQPGHPPATGLDWQLLGCCLHWPGDSHWTLLNLSSCS